MSDVNTVGIVEFALSGKLKLMYVNITPPQQCAIIKEETHVGDIKIDIDELHTDNFGNQIWKCDTSPIDTQSYSSALTASGTVLHYHVQPTFIPSGECLA